MMSARAMAMRWRWPPENSCGQRRASSGRRPTLVERLGDGGGAGVAAGRGVEQVERLGDEAGDAVARVERAVGVLEHRLHPPADGAVGGVDGLAVQADLAALDRVEAEDGAAEGGLAAARLADEAEALAGAQREADAVDGAGRGGGAERPEAGADVVADHLADLEERAGRPRARRRRAGARWRRGGRASTGGGGRWSGGAPSTSSTTSPSFMMAMRSAMPETTARSWVISRSPAPSSRARRVRRRRISAWVVTSSAVVGSSAMTRRGPRARRRWR